MLDLQYKSNVEATGKLMLINDWSANQNNDTVYFCHLQLSTKHTTTMHAILDQNSFIPLLITPAIQ